MKRVFPLLVLLTVSLASSCRQVRGFEVLTSGGAHVRTVFRAAGFEGTAAEIREGTLRFTGGGAEEKADFIFRKPLKETWETRVFSLAYIADVSPVYITPLYDGRMPGEPEKLPGAYARPVDCLVTVEPGKPLQGFSISSAGKAGVFTILSASVRPAQRGVEFAEGRLTAEAGLGLSLEEGGPDWELSFEAAGALPFLKNPFGGFFVRYGASSEPAPPLELLFPGGKDSLQFSAELLPLEGAVYIPASLIPVNSSRLTISIARPAAGRITRIGFMSLPDKDGPLTADFGLLLSWPTEKWRNPDYELFSWSLDPGILVFDTRDYGVQDELFRRLAFFTEKKGYRGQILTDRELAGKHGWNAHDYEPADLALFFNKASEEGIVLHPGELKLKSILVNNGVLVTSEGSLTPGRGAVLSLSRETDPALREKFAVHEAVHGLWFSSARYREGTGAIWLELTEKQRNRWLNFFSWMSYDPADEDLMVNEFQAYCMQQPADEIDDYMRRHPAFSGWSLPEGSFSEGAARVEELARNLFGFGAGSVIFVTGPSVTDSL